MAEPFLFQKQIVLLTNILIIFINNYIIILY